MQTIEASLPHLACLSQRPFSYEAIQDFMVRHTALPLSLASDGLGCFKVAASIGTAHEREITGGGKASVEDDIFVPVNTLSGNSKTVRTDTRHAIKFAKFAKYAYRYLAEVQFRFNRRYELRAILCGHLTALACAHRQPECGIRVA